MDWPELPNDVKTRSDSIRKFEMMGLPTSDTPVRFVSSKIYEKGYTQIIVVPLQEPRLYVVLTVQ
jgi:hypothetical protein